MFLCEHWPEVVGVSPGIATIPLFGVDIPSSSESVWLCTELTGAETNGHVELGQIFRPAGLLPGQNFRSGKILKILVVGNNVNQGSGTFQVMVPGPECFKDGEQFLVMGVIIQLWGCQSA